MQPQINFLEYGLRYASLGWHIFPIVEAEKHPYIKNWPQVATTNKEQITHWWTNWPQANIAITTGEKSKIVVIDIDVGKGGCDTLKALEQKFEPLPPTIQSITGTGGKHLIFAYPDTVTIRNSSNKVGLGIDVRGHGGYIIAPPSIHPNGWQYLWKKDTPPWDMQPALLPGWFIYLLLKEKKIKKRKRQHTPLRKANFPDQRIYWLKEALYRVRHFHYGRNEAGFWMVCQLRDAGISIDNAYTVMRKYVEFVPSKDHPYTLEEALATLNSVYAATPREPAGLPE